MSIAQMPGNVSSPGPGGKMPIGNACSDCAWRKFAGNGIQFCREESRTGNLRPLTFELEPGGAERTGLPPESALIAPRMACVPGSFPGAAGKKNPPTNL